MHNVTQLPQTVHSRSFKFPMSFYGHEELVFEVVPDEIFFGPHSILRECPGAYLSDREGRLHTWIYAFIILGEITIKIHT